MNKKYKYLSVNFLLFTLSNIGPRIISFLLVPIYTRYLTTADYGTGDIITSLVGFALPIVSVCIESAVLRFSFDKDYTHCEIITNSFLVLLRGSLICLVGVFIVAVIPGTGVSYYSLVSFFLMFLANGIYNLLSNYARGTEKVRIMVEMSLITTLSTCVLNIFILVFLHKGLYGYLFANYFGTFIAALWGALRLKLWKEIRPSYVNKQVRCALEKYSIPLIFNKIGWWINSSSDRYIITWILGASANGIYTVAYKIPTILSTCSEVFAQAWQLSAIKDLDPEDNDGFMSSMYNLYNAFLVVCCAGLILLDIPLAKILYANDFFAAWKYVPYLLISSVFGALSGFFGSIFVAVKDTRNVSTTTIAGALINIVLNFVLIFTLNSAMGAAIATLASNICVWIARRYTARKYIKLRIPQLKHIAMYIILLAQTFVNSTGFNSFSVSVQVVMIIALLLLNMKEFREIIQKMVIFAKNRIRS